MLSLRLKFGAALKLRGEMMEIALHDAEAVTVTVNGSTFLFNRVNNIRDITRAYSIVGRCSIVELSDGLLALSEFVKGGHAQDAVSDLMIIMATCLKQQSGFEGA